MLWVGCACEGWAIVGVVLLGLCGLVDGGLAWILARLSPLLASASQSSYLSKLSAPSRSPHPPIHLPTPTRTPH